MHARASGIKLQLAYVCKFLHAYAVDYKLDGPCAMGIVPSSVPAQHVSNPCGRTIVVCEHCKHPGHTKEQCYQLYGFPRDNGDHINAPPNNVVMSSIVAYADGAQLPLAPACAKFEPSGG